MRSLASNPFVGRWGKSGVDGGVSVNANVCESVNVCE